MPTERFQNLTVYQVAEQLADELWSVVSGWSVLARDTVGKQPVRAADSVGANIAEGSGRGSYQDNRRFVRIARGSQYETQHWLRRAFRRKLLAPEQVEKIHPLVERLAPLLNGYLRSIGRSGPPPNAPPKSPEDPDASVEGRRTKDEGRRTKDEGRRTKDEGRRTKDEGRKCLNSSTPPKPTSRAAAP